MKRQRHIVIRVSEKEMKQIKEMAKNAGLSVSEYLRTLAIYGEVK